MKLVGFEVEENWLTSRMATNPRRGTKPSGFRAVLRRLGVKYFEMNHATINDLKQWASVGFPVIVAWAFKGDGHYSLVTGITQKGLSIIEPYKGRLISIGLRRFAELWHDPCNHTTGWMMVIKRSHRYNTRQSPV